MKSKKIISVIAAAVLAFGMTANAAATMTIDEATAYALENSPAYKSAVAAAKSSEYAAKVANRTYNDYHDSDNALAQMSISSFDLYLVRMGYVKSASEFQMRVAQRASETAEYELKTNVKNNYYTYLSNKEKVKIAEDNLANSKERLAAAQKQLGLGLISELEVKVFEINVFGCENALKMAQSTCESSLLTLKNTMGYNLDEELEVSGTFERNTEEVLSVEAVLAQLDSYSGKKTIDENLALAEERFKLAERWYFSSENEYWQEKYTFEKAQHDNITTVNELKMGIKQMYDALITIDSSLKNLDKMVERAKVSFDAGKLQYEIGMITAQDYVDVQSEYYSSLNQLTDLKLQEWVLKLQYKSFYTTEQ